MALRPGSVRSSASVLELGGSWIEEVPMMVPFSFRSVTATVVAAELGFTIATAVIKFVVVKFESSQVSVFEVAFAAENGTTAS